jgi:hypothetical protein
MSTTTNELISEYIGRLRVGGASGIEQYEQRLSTNANDPDVLGDLLLEARAALMFLQYGFKVAMRDRPDLRIELDKQVAYVEVKHFREKEQDRADEKAMLEPSDRLVLTGELLESEGAVAWRQIVDVAIAKAGQYVSNAPNILVVESSSPSLELMLGTAVHVYDEEVLKSDDLRLRRLSGMMLVQTDWIAIREPRNVDFCPTAHAAAPLSPRLVSALANVRIDLA